jgi:hypothetical protein
MCFGAFTATERCERCGRVHPAALVDRCLDLCAREQALQIDAELAVYLGSPEAGFFAWLANRPAEPAATDS